MASGGLSLLVPCHPFLPPPHTAHLLPQLIELGGGHLALAEQVTPFLGNLG
jgi:hypothetical protein